MTCQGDVDMFLAFQSSTWQAIAESGSQVEQPDDRETFAQAAGERAITANVGKILVVENLLNLLFLTLILIRKLLEGFIKVIDICGYWWFNDMTG